MRRNVTGAGLTMAMMILTIGCANCAGASTGAGSKASAPSDKSAGLTSPLVPTDFTVPTLVETANFRIVPLGPDVAKRDYDAYMSSIAHLQKTFSRSASWPRPGISGADAMRDMENEQDRFSRRQSFAYAVLTPDGLRERGCVYVSPSPVPGYSAVVRLWVTQADYDAGFDAELYKWVVDWMRKDWPFAKIAYPGRAIEWLRWDALVAQSKTGAAAH